MLKRLSLMFVLIISLSACRLMSNPPQEIPDATSTPFVIVVTSTPASVPTITPTQTPAPSATPQRVVSAPAQPTAACRVMNTWPQYVVVAGDVLSQIARRVNSTVDILVQANCLTNANSITVGQRLYVPVLPPPTVTSTVTAFPPAATVTPTIPETVYQGTVALSAYITADAGNYLLLRGETITLTWNNPPAGLGKAAFSLIGQGFPSVGQLIGEDFNPADGLSVSFTVPADLRGAEIMASGVFANNINRAAYSERILVFSAPAAGQGCRISAASSEGEIIYSQPEKTSLESGLLTQGMTLDVLGRSVGGWYAVLPEGSAHTSSSLRWVAVDAALTFIGSC